MIFRTLHKLGIPSDVFYVASLASIGASIAAWAIRNEKSAPHAERFGIFIGLWAPTFMLIGSGLQQLEVEKGMGSPPVEQVTKMTEQVATNARENSEAALSR